MESLISLNENTEDASRFPDVVRSKPRGENNEASNKRLQMTAQSLRSCAASESQR